MKKFLSVFLAAALLMTMGVTVMAATEWNPEPNIEIAEQDGIARAPMYIEYSEYFYFHNDRYSGPGDAPARKSVTVTRGGVKFSGYIYKTSDVRKINNPDGTGGWEILYEGTLAGHS